MNSCWKQEKAACPLGVQEKEMGVEVNLEQTCYNEPLVKVCRWGANAVLPLLLPSQDQPSITKPRKFTDYA